MVKISWMCSSFRSLNECKLEKINKCQTGFFSASTFCYLRKKLKYHYSTKYDSDPQNRNNSPWFKQPESVDDRFEIFISFIAHKHAIRVTLQLQIVWQLLSPTSLWSLSSGVWYILATKYMLVGGHDDARESERSF